MNTNKFRKLPLSIRHNICLYYPYAEHLNWKYLCHLNILCALFCGSRYGNINIPEKEAEKEKKRIGRKMSKEKKNELKKKREEEKKLKPKKKPVKKEQVEYIEFPYIDEVPKEWIEGKRIYIDPGKRDLLSITDDDGVTMTYSNKRRVSETKRLKYQRLIKNYKDQQGITKIENELSNYNSKTCDLKKFKEYMTKKNEINSKLFKLYSDVKFRQYRWYAFINRKRCVDTMLNDIQKTYGKDIVIIIGDWSIGKQMRNFISTPNLGIKRELKKRFKRVFNIDEFRTSKLHHQTEEECKNYEYKDKKEKKRELHSVLTYKMENHRLGCINRDRNGRNNIKKVFEEIQKIGKRPLRYQRGYEIKVTNQPAGVSNGNQLEGK